MSEQSGKGKMYFVGFFRQFDIGFRFTRLDFIRQNFH